MAHLINIIKKFKCFTNLDIIVVIHPEIVIISQDWFFKKLGNMLGIAYVLYKFTMVGGESPAIRVIA